jgi:glycosyltransferase involved in cell wall biosynthesis
MKNESEYIFRLLDSLKSQEGLLNSELVFLDSESTDDSVKKASRDASSIYSIKSEEFQFGKSCNQIISACKGEFILLVSAHIYFENNFCIENALRIIKGNPTCAAIYFGQTTQGKVNIDFSSYEKLFLKKRFPKIQKNIKKLSKNQPISNAAVIIRKKAWENLEFPEVNASEDVIWAQKISTMGWQLHYAGDIRVIHNHNEAPPKIYNRVKINKIAQYGKNPMPIKAAIAFIKITLGLLILEKEKLTTSAAYGLAHAKAYII